MLVYKNFHVNADIAQLVELLICNQWVGSSSLSIGTIKKASVYRGFFVLIYSPKIRFLSFSKALFEATLSNPPRLTASSYKWIL